MTYQNATPDPVWPVLVLAVIQLADAVFCLRPLPFMLVICVGVTWACFVA